MKCTIPEISWHNRDPVLSIDFQYSDGRLQRLATGGTDSHVLIWLVQSLQNGHVRVEFASDLCRHNRAVNVVRFSPDGKLLASGDDEAVIWLWRLLEKGGADIFTDEIEKENKEHWGPLRTLRTHIEDVCDLSWSPDSNFLISGSVDNTAVLWDVQKGRNIEIFSEHKGFVQGVAWDPKNQFLATLSSDRTCRIYGVHSKKVLHRIDKVNIPSSSSSEQTQKRIRMYHDDTLKSFCRRLTFTPDGELLITPAGLLELEDDKKINVTYVFARNSLNRPALYLPNGDKGAVAVRCCPVLFQLRPLDRKTTNLRAGAATQEDSNAERYALFNLPYRIVFAVATLNSVLFYDTQQPLPFAHVSSLHYTRLSDLSWSVNGRMLVVSSTDGYCSFITFDDGELGTPYASTSALQSLTTPPKNEDRRILEPIATPLEAMDVSDADGEKEETSDLKLQLELTNEPPEVTNTGRREKAESNNEEQNVDSTALKTQPTLGSLNATLPTKSTPKVPRRVQFVTLSSPKQRTKKFTDKK